MIRIYLALGVTGARFIHSPVNDRFCIWMEGVHGVIVLRPWLRGFTCISVEHGNRIKGQKLLALKRRHRVADGKSVLEPGGNAELFQESLF